MTSLRRRSD
jgi:hypothetical protein